MQKFLKERKSKLFCVYDLLPDTKLSETSFTFSPDETYALICDPRNHCIRKICFKTERVSIFAGSPGKRGNRNGSQEQAKFSCPTYLQFSPDGKYILVCDPENYCIRNISLETDIVSILVKLSSSNLLFSSDGKSVLFSRRFNNCIGEFDVKSSRVCTFAGVPGLPNMFQNGPKKQAIFNLPTSITLSPDCTYMLVCDYWNHCVRKICLESKQVSTFAGNPKGRYFRNGSKEQALFMYPKFCIFSPDGTYILICDEHVIRKICVKSGQVSTFCGNPNEKGLRNGPKEQAIFDSITSLAFSKCGKFLIICDKTNIKYMKIKN
jgi:WD40 repeat protein